LNKNKGVVMNEEVLLFTSGIDSYIAKYYLEDSGHKIDCLYFDHGGRYCKHEVEKIKSLDFEVIISYNLQLGGIEEENAYIPNRNLLMTIMAQSFGYKKVWLGGSLSDRIGDNKSEVCDKLSSLLIDVNESYCKISSPFYGCYKEDMVKWFIRKHPAFRMDLLTHTFSCFNPLKQEVERYYYYNNNRYTYKTKECMACSACFRKAAVLMSADIYIDFISDDKNNIILHYNDEFRNPLVQTPRSEATMNYIHKWNLNHI